MGKSLSVKQHLKCNQMHHPDALFHPGCRPFPSQGPYPTHAKSSGGIKPKIQRSPSYYETWKLYTPVLEESTLPQLRLDPGK